MLRRLERHYICPAYLLHYTIYIYYLLLAATILRIWWKPYNDDDCNYNPPYVWATEDSIVAYRIASAAIIHIKIAPFNDLLAAAAIVHVFATSVIIFHEK